MGRLQSPAILALLTPFNIGIITSDDCRSYVRGVPKEKHLTGKIFTQCIERNILTLHQGPRESHRFLHRKVHVLLIGSITQFRNQGNYSGKTINKKINRMCKVSRVRVVPWIKDRTYPFIISQNTLPTKVIACTITLADIRLL